MNLLRLPKGDRKPYRNSRSATPLRLSWPDAFHRFDDAPTYPVTHADVVLRLARHAKNTIGD
jgi:hypothetical protein